MRTKLQFLGVEIAWECGCGVAGLVAQSADLPAAARNHMRETRHQVVRMRQSEVWVVQDAELPLPQPPSR